MKTHFFLILLLTLCAVSKAQTITTVAGGNGQGSDSNQLYGPNSVYVDKSGNIYVVDGDNNRVQKFPPGSNSSTNGITIAGGNGPGNSLNELFSPSAVCLDNSGNIYVADALNHRILKFPPGSTSATDGVVVPQNIFNVPNDIYIDSAGNIFVSDGPENIVAQLPVGNYNWAIMAGGSGYMGGEANQLNAPSGVFADRYGYIYVADGNNRIQKFPPGYGEGRIGVTIAGGNGQGTAADQFDGSAAVYMDKTGNLYVCDESNSRVLKFPPGSNSATSGVIVAGGNGRGSNADQLYGPIALFVDTAGNIYIADGENNRVQKWGQDQPAQAISTGQPPNDTMCAGTTLNIPFTYSGMFNTGNVFTAQLSDSTGSFADPDTIGTLDTASANMITVTMPSLAGNGYRIRIVGSDPPVTGYNNGSNLFIDAAPQAPVLSPASGCESTDTIIATGTNGATVKWYDNGSLYYSGTYNYYIAYSQGTYNAVCVSANGCMSPYSNSVIVYPVIIPTVAITAAYNNLCKGTPDTFNASSTNGGPDPTYIWYRNGVQVQAGSSTYIADSLNYADKIWVTVISDSQCATSTPTISNTIEVNIIPGVPPALATSGKGCLGTDTLELTDTYEPTLVRWFLNGTLVDTGFSSSYTPAAAGTYTAMYVSAIGCSSLLSDSVIIHSAVTPAVTLSASHTYLCGEVADTFTATPDNGGANPLYTWYRNTYEVDNGSASTYEASDLNNNDSIWVVLSSDAFCITTNNVSSNHIGVTVIEEIGTPFISISGNGCSGVDSIYAEGYEGQSTIQWFLNGSLVDTGANPYHPKLPGTYTAEEVSGQCVTPVSNAVQVKSSAAPSSTLTVIPNSPTICSNVPVTFIASANDPGITAVYEFTINGLALQKGVDSTFTQNGLFSGDTVTCVMVSNSVCAGIDTTISNNIVVTITPAANPVITMVEKDTLGTGTFNSYQWLQDNTLLSDANSQTFPPFRNGIYSVIVIDTNGCSDTSAPYVFYFVGINEVTNQPGIQLYPNPTTGTFTLETTNHINQPYIIYDMLGNKVWQDIITADKQVVELKGLAAGSYELKVGNSVLNLVVGP